MTLALPRTQTHARVYGKLEPQCSVKEKNVEQLDLWRKLHLSKEYINAITVTEA